MDFKTVRMSKNLDMKEALVGQGVHYIDGSVQDCGNYTDNALELLVLHWATDVITYLGIKCESRRWDVLRSCIGIKMFTARVSTKNTLVWTMQSGHICTNYLTGQVRVLTKGLLHGKMGEILNRTFSNT